MGIQKSRISSLTIGALVLISDDRGESWYEWIGLDRDETGGARKMAVISKGRIVVGTGNRSANGKTFRLAVKRRQLFSRAIPAHKKVAS